tara:strand:+ start:297 stop:791 length:495 start_codon:yes stop_codon:yes gene_type:complete
MAADKATVNVSASVLPDDCRVSVGGTITHEIADGAGDVSKWISYAIDIDTSSEVAIPADIGYLNGSNASGLSPTRTASGDKIEFVVLKHSGFRSDGTTASAASECIHFNFTDSVAGAAATGNLQLNPGEVWWGRLSGTPDSADLTAIAIGNDVKLLVYAILDDA